MDPFDNLFWKAMTGAQAPIAVGTDRVRRYATGFSPIAAFADPRDPDLETLATLVQPGERIFTPTWSGAVPASWTLHLDTFMLAMVWDGRAAPARLTTAPDTATIAASSDAARIF